MLVRALRSKIVSIPRPFRSQKVTMASGPGSNSSSSMPNPAAAIDFLMLLTNLKVTKRTGWVRCNVQQPESIAGKLESRIARTGLIGLGQEFLATCHVCSCNCASCSLVISQSMMLTCATPCPCRPHVPDGDDVVAGQ
jgi:hypothetical protein